MRRRYLVARSIRVGLALREVAHQPQHCPDLGRVDNRAQVLADLLVVTLVDLAHELLELRVLGEVTAKVCSILRSQPQHTESQPDTVTMIEPLQRAR